MGAGFEPSSCIFMIFMLLFQAPKVKCADLKLSMDSTAAQMLSWFGIDCLVKVRQRFTIQTLICRAMLGAWSIFRFQHCKLHQDTSSYLFTYRTLSFISGLLEYLAGRLEACLNPSPFQSFLASCPSLLLLVPVCSKVSVRARNLEHIQKKPCKTFRDETFAQRNFGL